MLKTLSFGTVRQWHWISSALCLAGMLLFAVTGITLNHAGQIEAKPLISTVETQLPDSLIEQLEASAEAQQLRPAVKQWVEQQLPHSISWQQSEWSEDELYLALPRPGGDGWLSLDLVNGDLLYESTDRGWIAYFNDLHKGRNSGILWSWFIDIFAGVCVIFSLTGLVLLQRQASARPTTWPLTVAGFLLPILIMLLFIH